MACWRVQRLRVHAGVHHEPDGAPHVVGELAELVVGVVVQAQLVAQRLAVQGPALAVGHVVAVAAELGDAGLLGGERRLEVVPGHGLVQREGHHLPARPRLRAVEVHQVRAGARAVATRPG